MTETDVPKLHSESLQLRGQQFVLGTLALTGSGLSVWIAPGIAAVTQRSLEEPVLIGAVLSWLVMLYILFYWSLALRKVITVISEYLKIHRLSDWEQAFYVLHNSNRKLIASQTWLIVIVFLLYGVIVVGGSLVSTTSDSVHVSRTGFSVLLAAVVAYLIGVTVTYKRFRTQNAELELLCRKEFSRKNSEPSVAPERR